MQFNRTNKYQTIPKYSCENSYPEHSTFKMIEFNFQNNLSYMGVRVGT